MLSNHSGSVKTFIWIMVIQMHPSWLPGLYYAYFRSFLQTNLSPSVKKWNNSPNNQGVFLPQSLVNKTAERGKQFFERAYDFDAAGDYREKLRKRCWTITQEPNLVNGGELLNVRNGGRRLCRRGFRKWQRCSKNAGLKEAGDKRNDCFTLQGSVFL